MNIYIYIYIYIYIHNTFSQISGVLYDSSFVTYHDLQLIFLMHKTMSVCHYRNMVKI